jgi:hypothetical protein
VDTNEHNLSDNPQQAGGEAPVEPVIAAAPEQAVAAAPEPATAAVAPEPVAAAAPEPAAVAPGDGEAAVAQTPADADMPLPPHFEPIPEAKIKKAKRTRIVLMVIIALLVLALAGMGAVAAYVYINQESNAKTIESDDVKIDTAVDDSKVQDKGTVQATESPNLVAMFGKTGDEVEALLGSDYALTKTEEVEEQDNPEIKQLVTFSYSPPDKQSSATVGTTQTQNIYLSLNEQGQTIEVYFVSSIDLLGYPISTFSELTATKDTITKAVSAAGATVASDFAYTAPKQEQYIVYVDPDAKTKKVKKETATFNGNLQSEIAPTTFSLTLTYDYGASGVADTPDKKPTQRTLYLTLR